MKKDDFLMHITETAYNVGYGAKKHFATYDMVNKVPGIINFVSISFGIYALVIDDLSSKFLAATITVFGIVGIYISLYEEKKNDYEKVGVILTKLFNELRKLYSDAKVADENNLSEYEQQLKTIESEYYKNCISKQILFSDWYAHYKFFWQHQIDWIAEQKQFDFFRDKIPLTLSLVVVAAFFMAVGWGLIRYFG
ncbi:MAG: SLATT domain-containing protein [Desulfurivibrionaceae bacterium]|jgi:hypothetical protein